MGKIYVPITSSVEAKKAITRAIEFAHEFKMEVDAIYVLDRDLISKLERYKIFSEEGEEKFAESLKKNVEKYLSYAKKHGEKMHVPVNEVHLEGDTYDQITEYITRDQEKVKIVCIAKKTGGEYMKDIFSDIERKILLYAKFDMLVVGEEI